jgi:hypothetical protein
MLPLPRHGKGGTGYTYNVGGGHAYMPLKIKGISKVGKGIDMNASSMSSATPKQAAGKKRSLPLCAQLRAYNDAKTGLDPFQKREMTDLTSQLPERICRRAARVGYINVNSGVIKKEKPGTVQPLLSAEDVDAVMNFMDSNGDGEITLDELMRANRRAKRMNDKILKQGRKMLRRLLALLGKREMSIEDWFFHMDGQTCANNHSDGRVTTRELQKGLKLMSDEEPPDSELRFNPKDVQKLVRFMDPNADGDLSLEECSLAVEKLEQGELESLCIEIFQRIETHMKAAKIEFRKFFEELDHSGDGSLSTPELRDGLMAITEARESEKAAVSAAQGGSDPLTDAFRAWHTCFATCTFDPVSNEGLLKVFALQLEFYATNTGKTGTALKVVLPRPEFELRIAECELTFVEERCFESDLVFKLRTPTLTLFVCVATHMEMAWWQKALFKLGARYASGPGEGVHLIGEGVAAAAKPPGSLPAASIPRADRRPVCLFGGPMCKPPFCRRPRDLFMATPYAPVSTTSCVACFMENDESRRRQLHVNWRNPAHKVDHGLCNGSKQHSWRMLPPPAAVPNVNRADAILNLPEPWATPFGHLDDDAKEKPSLDSILGNFPAGTFALDKKEEEAVVLDVPWDVPAGATNS